MVSRYMNCNDTSGPNIITFGPGQTGGIETNTFATLPGAANGAVISITVPASNMTIRAFATAAFLGGQTWSANTTTNASTELASESSSASHTPTTTAGEGATLVIEGGHPPNDRTTLIGVGVGVASLFVLLLGLSLFFLRRHRKRHRGEATTDNSQPPSREKPQEGSQEEEYIHYGFAKPELEGSHGPHILAIKPELDASVTRAELEGDVVAELEGNVRAELEAHSFGTGKAGFHTQESELQESVGVTCHVKGVNGNR